MSRRRPVPALLVRRIGERRSFKPSPHRDRHGRELAIGRSLDERAQRPHAAHAFAAEGEAFTAESAEHGITGRFDAGGAVLTGGGEGFAVRATGWGRAGSMEATSTVVPELGACVAGRADPVGDCVRRLELSRGTMCLRL